MSNGPAIVTSAALLWLIASPPCARAQTPFLNAVHELAATADGPRTTPDDITRRRLAARARLMNALRQWDRDLEDLKSRLAQDLLDAPPERAFQLHIELGLAYRQRGLVDDALHEFDAAIAVRANASDVHLLQGLTLDAAGRTADAAKAYRTAWLRDSASPSKAYLVLTSPQALTPAERERAMKVLHDVVVQPTTRKDPTHRAPFLVLDPVPDTLARTPIVGDAVVAHAFARLSAGQLDEALSALNRTESITAEAPSPAAQFNSGRADESEGRYADARRAYTAALDGTLAGRSVLHVGIGRLAQVDGDLDAAVEAFRHAVRLNPNDPLIHRELANTYTAAGRPDEALAELAAALLIDPLDTAAMTAAGQIFLDTDRVTDAVNVLTRAAAINPSGRDSHYALAMALTRAGRADDAARTFDAFERLSQDALEERRREVNGQAGPAEASRK